MNNKLIINFLDFLKRLARRALRGDISALSAELTFRILLAFFPFVIFLVSLIGFLNLSGLSELFYFLPDELEAALNAFINEISARPSAELLSVSLIICIISSFNGFKAVINSLSKAQVLDDQNKLKILKKLALSGAIMFIFCFALALMMIIQMFSRPLSDLALRFFGFYPLGIWVTFAHMTLLTLAAAAIYRLTQPRSQRVWPGALTAMILWTVSTWIFGVVISRYSAISLIYGSLASIFILIVWLNLVAFFLLLGSAVNAELK